MPSPKIRKIPLRISTAAAAVLVLAGVILGLEIGGGHHAAPTPVTVHQVDQASASSTDTDSTPPVTPTVTVTTSYSPEEQDVPTPTPTESAPVVGHYNTTNPGSVDTGPRPAPMPIPPTPCQTPTDYALGVHLTDPCPQ
jgi:hypothetical protein